MKKGISLPIETVVVIVLAVAVLLAMLYFFGLTQPPIDRIKLEQQRIGLCSSYISADSECRSAMPPELQDVCSKLDAPSPKACCTGCPKLRTKEECTAAGGSCINVICSQSFEMKTELGTCEDNKEYPFCCKA